MSSHINHSSSQSSSRKGTRYPFSSHLSVFYFSPYHCAFLALLTTQKEPSSFEQANCDPLRHQTMYAELQALEWNKHMVDGFSSTRAQTNRLSLGI